MKYIVSGSGMLDVNNWLELCYLAPATLSKSPTFTSKATLSVCTEGLSAIQARAVQALIDVLRTLGPCPSRLAFSTKGTIKTGSASTGESPVLVLTCATVEAGWFHTFICKCQDFSTPNYKKYDFAIFLTYVLCTLGPCPSRLAFTGVSPDLVLTCATVEARWFHTFIYKC